MPRRGENIYKRKDGRWEGRFKINEKNKYKSVYGHSYTEVKNKLLKKKNEIKLFVNQCNSTFGELARLWLLHKKNRIKESSYTNYSFKLQNHIIPAFGNVKYSCLTAEKFNRFSEQKLSSGLSLGYVYDVLAVIKSICNFAHRQYNYENKSEFIVVKKVKNKTTAKLLSDESHKKLNKYLLKSDNQSNIGILLASATGMRIGEICALKWENINLEKRIVTVRSTMQRIKSGEGKSKTKLIITPPKTATSIREIPIPDFICSKLKSLYTNSDDYILSGSTKPTEPRTMQYRFKSILKKLDISYVNFHSLRHSFATKCIEIGFDVKTLSEILGHSSVEITLNRYVHSSIGRKFRCMKLLSKSFFENL